MQGRPCLRIKLKVRLNQFGRCECQPLIQQDVGVIAALEYLQEAHLGSSDVLDIVPHREGHEATSRA
jgi:hypothetical protein